MILYVFKTLYRIYLNKGEIFLKLVVVRGKVKQVKIEVNFQLQNMYFLH